MVRGHGRSSGRLLRYGARSGARGGSSMRTRPESRQSCRVVLPAAAPVNHPFAHVSRMTAYAIVGDPSRHFHLQREGQDPSHLGHLINRSHSLVALRRHPYSKGSH